jgi:molybdopterin-synthase adenylyltransferase
MLSKNEIEIYKRQIGIIGWGESVQEKIKSSSIFVAGAGGLGSPVLFYLAAAGVGELIFIDSDEVDLSNLNRQIIHDNNSIGTDKVKSAEEKLHQLNPYISLKGIKDRLTKKTADKLIPDVDLIIDCVDNFSTRHLLNVVSVKRKIPMIHGGVGEFRGQITFLSPPETACLACFFPEKDEKGITYIAGATAGILGSMQALEAIKYLTGIGENLKNRLLFFDGLTMRFETINISVKPSCKVCGDL